VEELGRDERVPGPGAVQGEQTQAQRGDGQGGQGGDRAPAPIVTLDQPQGEGGNAARDQDRAQWTGPADRVPGHGREPPPAEGERGQTDRHVDQEDPAPAGRDQQPSDHRAERGGEPAHRGPGADGAVAPLRLSGGQDET
jgi:hypothetical protein